MEKLVDHFGKISSKFSPLRWQDLPLTYDRPIRPIPVQEVLDRLCAMKKPRSAVTIDPLMRFINCQAIHYAVPLTAIINQVRQGQQAGRLEGPRGDNNTKNWRRTQLQFLLKHLVHINILKTL